LSLPKSTAVAPVKPAPVMVTWVPPVAGPELGTTLVTTGTQAKRSAELVRLVPPGVVTVTSTVPLQAGEVAVIEAGELTVQPGGAGVLPKSTAVAPVKPAPVMVELGAASGRARAGDDPWSPPGRKWRPVVRTQVSVSGAGGLGAPWRGDGDVDRAAAGREVAVIESPS